MQITDQQIDLLYSNTRVLESIALYDIFLRIVSNRKSSICLIFQDVFCLWFYSVFYQKRVPCLAKKKVQQLWIRTNLVCSVSWSISSSQQYTTTSNIVLNDCVVCKFADVNVLE